MAGFFFDSIVVCVSVWYPLVIKREAMKNRRSGFITSYVLTGLILLSLAVGGLAFINKSNDAGRKQEEVRKEMLAQVELIRSKLVTCALLYPAGNNGTAFRPAYPARPVSGLVADLTCPGAPSGSEALWPGEDGVSMPRQITGFGAWSYANDGSSMRISIDATDANYTGIAGANHAARRFGSDASVSGSTYTFVLAR